MTILDTILIIILFIFIGLNLATGLIHAAGSIVGLIMGILVAKFYYIGLSGYLLPILGGNETAAQVVGFIVIFALVARIIGLVFHYLQKFLKIIPLASTVNRLAGAALGFVEGVLVLGVVLILLKSALPADSSVAQAINQSAIASFMIFITAVIKPLIPEALKKIKTIL